MFLFDQAKKYEESHLGSYIALTNSSGKIFQRNCFDVWGNPIPVSKVDTAGGVSDTTLLNFTITNRGFTGHEHYPFFKIINMNGRLYEPVIGRFFSPDKYVANSSFTQDFNRYSYCRNNPLMYVDPSGDFFWFFPTFSWSRDGGFSIGFTVGVGIPGLFSASASIGYNFQHQDFSMTISGTAAFNTGYVSISSQSGVSVGWTFGMTPQSGFPISTNFATIGINYNITHNELSGNISAWSISKDGNRFNPSLSVAVFPEEFTNLVRGQGFRNNDQVLSRFVAAGKQQQALYYWEFKGTYAPNHPAWEEYGYSPAMVHPETGEILYHDFPFQGNYDRLALIAHHESIHQRDWRPGYKYTEMEIYKDEWSTYMKNYKNLGLYPSQEKEIRGRINDYGLWSKIYEAPYTFFTPEWWHFIYKIPRLW